MLLTAWERLRTVRQVRPLLFLQPDLPACLHKHTIVQQGDTMKPSFKCLFACNLFLRATFWLGVKSSLLHPTRLQNMKMLYMWLNGKTFEWKQLFSFFSNTSKQKHNRITLEASFGICFLRNWSIRSATRPNNCMFLVRHYQNCLVWSILIVRFLNITIVLAMHLSSKQLPEQLCPSPEHYVLVIAKSSTSEAKFYICPTCRNPCINTHTHTFVYLFFLFLSIHWLQPNPKPNPNINYNVPNPNINPTPIHTLPLNVRPHSKI